MSEAEIVVEVDILDIGELIEFDSGFKKREFKGITAGDYPQTYKFELTKDKADKVYFDIGDTVEVKANVRGRDWTNKEGKVMNFLSLQAWFTSKVDASSGSADAGDVPDSNDPPF